MNNNDELTLSNAILADNYRRRDYDVPDDLFARQLIKVAPLNEREAEMMQQMEEARQEILELKIANNELALKVSELTGQIRSMKAIETGQKQRGASQQTPHHNEATKPSESTSFKPRGGVSL